MVREISAQERFATKKVLKKGLGVLDLYAHCRTNDPTLVLKYSHPYVRGYNWTFDYKATIVFNRAA